ncbi:MAG: hypothetical protein M1827_000351 [Pycnora praestabilis]|nr:MAG: hypothetical protein M1827_000351 [Pycnora praestabilis]
MAPGESLLQTVDTQLGQLLSGWSIYTTIIALVFVAFLSYPLLTWEDPDTHPFLLARQSYAAPVRQAGESAVYRSLETPPGEPLKTGLRVKDPGTSKWAPGRDGDLRDIWRQAVKGSADQAGGASGNMGKILTVLGREEVVEHALDDISCEINVVGQFIKQQRGQVVAIYLPNCVELLAAVFAAPFYGIKSILLPYNQSSKTLVHFLQQTKPDFLIAAAGALPLEEVLRGYPGLKQIMWVVKQGSRHMDWNEVPEGIGGKFGVSVWHEIVEERKSNAGSGLPANVQGEQIENLVTVCQNKKNDTGELVEFMQKNLVAATAALISSLPVRERIRPSDLFMPVDSLTSIYPLTLTFAALFSNASIALNSVAGAGADLVLGTRGVAPTIIVASAEMLANTHRDTKGSISSSVDAFIHRLQIQTLTAGRMPKETLLTQLSGYKKPAIGTSPGKLRLLYVSNPVSADSPFLSSAELADLRIFTGARVIHALTAAKVAGAVAQTGLFDYRIEKEGIRKPGHFGAPLSCVEIKLVDANGHRTTEEGDPKGEIIVSGPAVVDGETRLGVIGTFREDNTLSYVCDERSGEHYTAT